MPHWQPIVLMNELQYVQYVGTDAEDDDAFTRHAFNVSSSNVIASSRPLPDTRHSRYRTGHCRPVSLYTHTAAHYIKIPGVTDVDTWTGARCHSRPLQ